MVVRKILRAGLFVGVFLAIFLPGRFIGVFGATQTAEVDTVFTDACDDDSKMLAWSGIVVPYLRLGANTARILSDSGFNYFSYQFDRNPGDTIPLMADITIEKQTKAYVADQEYLAVWHSDNGTDWTLLGIHTVIDTQMVPLVFEDVEIPADQGSFYLRIGGPTLSDGSTTLAYVWSVEVSFAMSDTVANCGEEGAARRVTDLVGPYGFADCRITLHDFAAFALDWLECTDPAEPILCGSHWYE